MQALAGGVVRGGTGDRQQKRVTPDEACKGVSGGTICRSELESPAFVTTKNEGLTALGIIVGVLTEHALVVYLEAVLPAYSPQDQVDVETRRAFSSRFVKEERASMDLRLLIALTE